MDETRKAASVGQLKELHDAVMSRIEKLETAGKEPAKEDNSALLNAVSQQLVLLQQTVSELAKRQEQQVDLKPVMEQFAALAKLIARPLTRTGEATLPDGGRIQLQVVETRQ